MARPGLAASPVGLPWPYPSTGRPARGLPGALLYAEMHYRWWPLPSRYFRKEPEILADAPRRVEPGRPLPIYCFQYFPIDNPDCCQ